MNFERNEWGSRAAPTQCAQPRVSLVRPAAGLRAAAHSLASLIFFAASLATSARAQTQATTLPLMLPSATAFDAAGNLYFAETGNHVVRKVTSAGIITTVAGNGVQGFAGDGGLATSAELDSPAGLALDAAGDLYIADSHNQRVREVNAATGIIATIAGTGAAGFSGDGGMATAARLDLPTALALDTAGNLYVADTNNHRVRRIAAATGAITTVAGNGVEAFTGDNGPATSASIDSPNGLALDAAGNLYIADTHNGRVREVSAASGLISTVAGAGVVGGNVQSFGGDGGAATAAGLALPRGLTMDAAGNLYFADSANHRIRRISPSGTITTVAGQGTETFAGDSAPAVSASLDSPRSVAVSPAGLLTLADSGNQRVRQLDALPAPGPDIHTIAGLGATIVVSRALAHRAVGGCLWQRLNHCNSGHIFNCNRQRYISGYKRRSADHAGHGGPDLRLGELQHCHAGHWRAQPRRHLRRRCGPWRRAVLRAGDDGDAARRHHCAQPGVNPLRPGHSPAQRHAHGRSRAGCGEGRGGLHFYCCGLVSRGTLSHLRNAYRQRGGQLHGRTVTPAANLSIAQTPTQTSLSASTSSPGLGLPVTLSVQSSSTTSGVPTGSITLSDGSTTLSVVPLSASAATFTTSSLGLGAHNLCAAYSGDANFLPSSSATAELAVGAASDFTMTATGATSQSIPKGSSATYSFSVAMLGAAMSSPIALAVQGVPLGATSSINPSYIPPGGAVTSFTVTIQTPLATLDQPSRPFVAGSFPSGPFASGTPNSSGHGLPTLLALLLLPAIGFARRRRAILLFMAAASSILLATLATGCGNRINADNESIQSTTYTLTVTGTATGPTGNALVHTATVTLQVLQ